MNHVNSRSIAASRCKTRTYRWLAWLTILLVGVAKRCCLTADALMVGRHSSVHHHPPVDAKDASRTVSSTIRIRSMRDNDLSVVASLLASEIILNAQQQPQSADDVNDATNNMFQAAMSWNRCKAHLDRMRQQSVLETELRHRLRAIQEGRNVLSKFQMQHPEGIALEQQQQQHVLRWLWSHDSFRTKVQCAVELHQQQQPYDGSHPHSNSHDNPHHHPLCWEEHDINVTPADARWLQHVMMIAEEVVVVENSKSNKAGYYQGASSCSTTTTVIGFCEVGRMSTPLYYIQQQQQQDDDDDDSHDSNVNAVNGKDADHDDPQDHLSAPTILNLVISPKARRRGIATSLVSTAQRYVRRTWKERQLCLFVDTNNHDALSLYQRLGFVPCDVQPPSPRREPMEQEDPTKHVVLWQSPASSNSASKSSSQTRPKRFRHFYRQLS